MDPIEKLLSDLAPARSPARLDQTMIQLFDRAERKSRLRRAVTSLSAMAIMLVIGLAVGYGIGTSRVAPAAESVTYIVPLVEEQTAPIFDFTSKESPWSNRSFTTTIEVQPASAYTRLNS